MKKITLITFCVLAFSQAFSQKRTGNDADDKVVVIPCSQFSITRPLSELVKENPVDENKIYKDEESEDRENRKPQKFAFSPKDGEQYGNDPSTLQREMGGVPGKAPIQNWAGQTASGFRPFDPSGAAGPNNYVQMINSTTFRVYSKTGTVQLTATLGNLWSPVTGNAGDPIVMYDKAADRWFLAQFGTNADKKIYIAISTTSNPAGSYYTYTFTSPDFPDYLKFSTWQDGYYMTGNYAQKVFCFERTAMLAGTPTARSIYKTFSPPNAGYFFVPLPGDVSDGALPASGTPCPIFSYSDNGWGTGYTDAINIYKMAVTWGTTPAATITSAGSVPTAAFDATYDSNWNDVSQPGTTQMLDGIGGVLMYRAQYKIWSGYNTVVLTWAVKINSTQRSLKWCELRQNQSTGVWSMYQEGIYTPTTDTRWLGSIAMDNNGSIGLAYMKANSSSIYPGLYYTGRRTCDPLGTLPVTETVAQAGTGSQTGMNRDGDYAHLSLDPDGVTFWYTGEYMGGATGGSAAKTRIFSFQITPCASTPPVANFIGTPTTICAGQSVAFTDQSTNTPTSWSWTFTGGTPSTSTSQNPTVVYSTPGVYSVTLVATNGGGSNTFTRTSYITVNAVPATPTVTTNSPVCTGATINLSTPAVTGATYAWTGPSTFTSALQNPTRTGATTAMAGTYSLTVTTNGCTSTAGTAAVVVNTTPSVSVNSPSVCTGQTATLTALGGTTYSWNTGSTANPLTVTPAATTTYTVTGTTNGCSATAASVVTVNSIPAAPTAGSNSPLCAGSTINLTATTISGATYAWTGPSTFSSALQNPTRAGATTAMAGTYSVTATVNGCTSPSSTTTVVVNPAPATPAATASSPVCTGGTITLTTPTVAGATYAWTGPSFTSALQNPTRTGATTAMAGTYSVTVTAGGCTSAAGTATVVVNTTPTAPTAGSNTPVCAGSSINLTASAITGATYAWTGPSTYSSASQNPSIASATTAMAGTYSVTATVNGCTSPVATTAVVINAAPATPAATASSPVCTGGTITLTTPTVAGATYAWTGPSFTSTLQNPTRTGATTAMAGTYSVTVTAGGCTSAAGTATVVVNTTPTAPTAGSNTPVCAGSAINLTASAITGATYAWTGPSTYSSASQNPSIASATTAMAGTYSVTATVNGCTSPAATAAVTVNTTPATPAITTNSPVCTGGTITLSTPTVAGATYAWTGPAFTSALQNPTRTGATTAMSGTYSVTVTAGGCTSAAGTAAVVVNTTPTAPTAGSNTPVCAGSAINLTASAITNATYAWTGPSAYSSTSQNPSIASATTAMAGTYSVTATVNGCTSPVATTAVVINTTPATPAVTTNSPVCTGSTITLSTPAVGGATYAWTGPSAFSSTTRTPSRLSATTAMAGTYSVTVTAGGCTSAAGTATVVVNTTPTAPTAGSNSPVCVGSTINLTSTPVTGATYAWSGPSAFSSAVQNPTRTGATAVMAGTYSVTVTVNGCTSAATTTAVVVNTAPATPAATASSPVCTGGTITLSTPAVASATYAWSGPSTYSSASQNPSIGSATTAMAGTYSVTVTVGGCTSAAGTATVVVNTTPTAPTAGSNTPVCAGSTINLTATPVAGATYAWTGPSAFSSAVQNPSRTGATTAMAGTYSVTASANGCTSPAATTSVVVNTTPATPAVTASSPVCTGGTITLTTSAVAGATYSWSGPSAFTSAVQNPARSGATTAMAGTYSVTITSGGCTSAAGTATVVVNTTPTAPTAGSNSPVCSGSAINLTATPVTGATYAWTGPSAYSSTVQNPVRSGATTAMAGTYSITATVNGCTSIAGTTTVVVNAGPTAQAATSTPASCGTTTGTITLGATTGGTGPYSYSVNGSAFSATTSYSGFAAGSYPVIAQDANGCQYSTTVNVGTSSGPSAQAVSTVNATCGNANGVINIGTTTGGSGPYSYSVNGSGFTTTTSYTGFAAGSYPVIVKDANGCQFSTTATVGNSAGPTAQPVSTVNESCGNANGAINIGSTTGGTGPYMYSVDGGVYSTTTSYTGLTAGTHAVTVKDANGCMFTVNPVITNTPGPTGIAATTGNSTCGGNDGTITLGTVTGGTSPYTYSVDGSASSTTTNYTGFAAGTYPVVVTDNNGCTFSTSATVGNTGTTPATPTVTLAGSTLTSSSATGNQWYLNGSAIPGATGQNYTFTTNGDYTVIVTVGGCSSSASSVMSVMNVGIAESANDPYGLSVYPNPNDGHFTISFNAADHTSYVVEITNSLGQLIFKDDLKDFSGSYKKEMSVVEYGQGIYTISLTNSKKETVKKIVVY